MAYSDSKHDDNMEAGLLSTHQEERMSKEDLFQDSEFTTSTTNTRGTSPARRVLMAFGICFLLAIGLVSIGSATGMCPGHLRNSLSGDLSVKDAVHRHNPNLSHALEHMAKRQNTPIPGSSTTEATQPSATSESSSENDSSTSVAAPTTTEDNNPTTTAAPQSSSTAETQPSQTQETTEANPTTDSDESTTTEPTQSTITTGTRTTSSAVAHVLTSTLSNGGVTTLTSTSWVAVVPSAESTTAGSPNLQNAASQHSAQGIVMAAIGMVFGGLIML